MTRDHPTEPTPAEGGVLRGWNRAATLAPFLALLPLAAFGLVLLLALHAEREADRRRDLQRTATTLVAGLDSELRAGLRALDALAGSQHLETGDLAGFRREAQRLLAREPNWFTIALTDGERQLLNLRYPAEAALPPIQDLAAVGSVLRTGHPAPGGLVEGRVSFRVPVRVDGAVRFALVATQEATTFAQLLDRAGLPDGWSALLVDGEGRLIARAANGREAPETVRPALQRRTTLVETEEVLALALPVGESRWSLVVAAPPPGFGDMAGWWLALALGASAVLAGLGVATRAALRDRGDAARHQRRQREVLARAAEQERRRTEMMAAVSEELRAPLAGLLDYTERLADAPLPAEALGWVQQQRRAGHALLALVGDVLDFARLEHGTVALEDSDVEIAPLLDECAALMRPVALAKGLALRVAIDPGLPRWIRGDPTRLREVTTKLLDNAIRATRHGEVTLSARLTPRPERVEVAVTDTGPGHAEAELPRIFDRFRDPAPEAADMPEPVAGGGLGLAICRRLTEAMGGAIGVESQPGRGSRFAFWVPFRPGAAPAVARSGGALRILVAEDVPAARMLLTTVLERAGHAVTAAVDGPHALAALHGAGFDLVVLDLHMPGLGGVGVARAVRALPGEQGRVPLIALTADPAEELDAACRAAGFDAVLRKPFETRRLLGLVDGLRSRGAEPAPPWGEGLAAAAP
ncbi:hybrid sensor histidine kinase/response regulator [Falsiroseomonas selenitidurans]|uniref:histidine kinase n=1 Tax=Falsiroseomonas selenitidurans TaxID=2716335 RepID=A0ABX1DX97_9PROT|nr:ATP-binding protein [Falsiroseomonas selenitidurans]NKC29401.1 response regulator [Falsiroseomonas selenitidurans]